MTHLKVKSVDLYRKLGAAAAFRKDGMKIRQQLETDWDNFDRLEINKSKLKGASPSFLDEAFAKLFLNHSKIEIQKKLKFVGFNRYHLNNLNDLIAIRLRQKQEEKELAIK